MQANISSHPTKEQLIKAVQQHFSSQVSSFALTLCKNIVMLHILWQKDVILGTFASTESGRGTSDCGVYSCGQETSVSWQRLMIYG